MTNDLVDLQAEPPETFVAARDALVKRLKSEGDTDGAAVAKAMRKPTVAQWMTGEVERRFPEVVDKVRTASKAVADAQEAAITKGERGGLRDAIDRRRIALTDLERAVDATFSVTGRSTQHRDEVFSAIEAATTADVASGTFGIRDDLELPDLPEAAERKPTTKRDIAAERRAAEARDAIANAEEAVVKARRDLESAESTLEAVRARYS